MKRVLNILLLVLFCFSEVYAQNIGGFSTYSDHFDGIEKGCVPFDKSNPFNMLYLERFVVPNNSLIYPLFIEDGFYYVNRKMKKIVIPKRFNEAYPFYNDMALVRFNDEYAVIDNQGNYIVEPTPSKPQFHTDQPYQCLFGELNFNFAKENFNIYGGRPTSSKYSIFKERGKSGIRVIEDKNIVIEAVYDSIYHYSHYYPFDKNYVIANLNGKIGIIDFHQNVIQPFDNDSVIMGRNKLHRNHIVYIIGLYKSKFWHYYSVCQENKLLFRSPHKITRFTNNEVSISKPIGIYKIGEKYNLFFKDGRTLSWNYDWLHADMGIIGKRNNTVYLIMENGEEIPYY